MLLKGTSVAFLLVSLVAVVANLIPSESLDLQHARSESKDSLSFMGPRPLHDTAVVILNTIDGGIFALDASTGALRWTKSSGEAVARASPSFGYQDNANTDGESEAVGNQGAAGGKETVSSEGEDASSSENKTYGSELFHQNPMDANWKFQQEEESDFDIIPLYAPGGGLLTVSNGVMEPFGLRANEIVDQSPFVDNGVVVVGSKSTKLYAIDPETGQTSWTHFDKVEDEQCNSANPDADTLIITRSEYSLKVRNAKTGAHSWNVSIAEFRAHGPHSKHDHFKGVQLPVLVSGSRVGGKEIQCYDSRSGELLWIYSLPSTAICAHVWEMQHALELPLYADEDVLMRSPGGLKVGRHGGALFARVTPPPMIPLLVAESVENTAKDRYGLEPPRVGGLMPSDPARGSEVISLQDSLAEKNEQGIFVTGALVRMSSDLSEPAANPCRKGSKDYPQCLVGSYAVREDVREMLNYGMKRIDRPPQDVETKWDERLDPRFGAQGILSGSESVFLASPRRLGYSEFSIFIAAVGLVWLGWVLRNVFDRSPYPRESDVSNSDLRDMCPLDEVPLNGGGENALSKATTVGDFPAAETESDASAALKSMSNQDSSEEEEEDFDSEPFNSSADVVRTSSSQSAKATQSKISAASTKAAASNPSHKPKLFIPTLGGDMLRYGCASTFESLCQDIDDERVSGKARVRDLSRETSDEDSSWDESRLRNNSWDDDDRRQRSISLGSKWSVQKDLDEVMRSEYSKATKTASAPNSPKIPPASPGFFRQNQESRYTTDFEELGKIGRGAFGCVFRVRQRLDEREYAVKKIRLDKDEKSADNQRIMREVRCFSILSDHPKIVRYYGTWQETEMPSPKDKSLGDSGSLADTTWDASSNLFGEESDMTKMSCCEEPVNWLYIQMELCNTSLRQLLNSERWEVNLEVVRSPELEHSGIYNEMVDMYALGIVTFEMLHSFKTGMERIKVIEKLKSSMCSPAASAFAAMPMDSVFGPLTRRRREWKDANVSEAIAKIALPQELFDLQKDYEFEFLLILRLLGEKPRTRMTAKHMSDLLRMKVQEAEHADKFPWADAHLRLEKTTSMSPKHVASVGDLRSLSKSERGTRVQTSWS
ncbi:eIF-2alpha kinase 3 PEK/PERK, ER-targeted [Guillardia theta CCMP2712]|uniref:non-specific serine/threonine protein kinase n=1 Tax=Guillardia theta (strain CCMP2712) TaxID=905079 RepID=L1JNG5_GUITC|nr:eIF-2alpha kinase 3 PEK/PERK, ER-targeted [Guillardia theta CCMP2712]EKX49794.1 eIF-2alpha kinase 3 PEK/PERK, ER-targeted [Guillardia theta CCMP2712]|eukprot:XP_005836774.1 eIF-2alpha kinase 3 PEK/PERK, ER-targeted [Guillardia theta CCMP2712]